MASDEEVEAAQNRVVELRAKLEEARTGGAEKQKQIENDITIAQLGDEEARLEAELATVQEQNKVTVVRRGAAPILSTVKEQMAASVSHQKAVAKEITDSRATKNPVTPTDADETNTTTVEQSDNKSSAAKTQAGVKNKEEEAK